MLILASLLQQYIRAFLVLLFLCCAIMLLCSVTLYALGWLAACVEMLFQAENVYECINFILLKLNCLGQLCYVSNYGFVMA